ncbi:Uncharacterized protein HZ326_18545 [Fusarium oxysporum f. sp. albedinis]|nr:Uncharacterized protein HZ326_18545 [Fusarium oxysporum f. sp. albedinis]
MSAGSGWSRYICICLYLVSAGCRFVHWSYREMVTLCQRRLAVDDSELKSPWSCLDRGAHTCSRWTGRCMTDRQRVAIVS